MNFNNFFWISEWSNFSFDHFFYYVFLFYEIEIAFALRKFWLHYFNSWFFSIMCLNVISLYRDIRQIKRECANSIYVTLLQFNRNYKKIKTIDDLIELKFEKISIDLNVSWLDDFIWNDLMKLIVCKLIVCDFFEFCAVFVVSDLVINLNWFLIIMFNLICIVNSSIFVSILTIFMFSSRSWLIWLTIDNMWKFSIIAYIFNIAVLIFCNLMLIFCLFKLNFFYFIFFIYSLSVCNLYRLWH